MNEPEQPTDTLQKRRLVILVRGGVILRIASDDQTPNLAINIVDVDDLVEICTQAEVNQTIREAFAGTKEIF